MTNQITEIGVKLDKEIYHQSVSFGVSWFRTGEKELRNPTDQLIVDFVQDNIVEPTKEGYMDDDRLARMTGFLVGWIVGKYLD